MLKYTIPIILFNTKNEIGKIEVKYRYKNYDEYSYFLLDNDIVLRRVNQKFGIKLKHVGQLYERTFEIPQIGILDKLVKGIYLNQNSWERNYLLNSLIEQDGNQ